MKSTIVFVFNMIITLIVSGILWMLTIGGLDTNRMNDGYIGDATKFKELTWQSATSAYCSNYNTNTMNSGSLITESYDELFERYQETDGGVFSAFPYIN